MQFLHSGKLRVPPGKVTCTNWALSGKYLKNNKEQISYHPESSDRHKSSLACTFGMRSLQWCGSVTKARYWCTTLRNDMCPQFMFARFFTRLTVSMCLCSEKRTERKTQRLTATVLL